MARIDRASRLIHAPPSTLYRAFAEAGAMEQWLPPAGMTARMLSFDFREGRGYRMRLTYEQADPAPAKSSENTDEVEVRLVRLVENEYIEQAVVFDSERPEFAGEMKMTWTFIPEGNGTEVSVRCENVPPGIRPEDHRAGLTSTLENLAKYIE